MPIYEYQCQECGAVSEHLTDRRESGTAACTSCGSSRVERIMSASAVLIKTAGRLPGKTCCEREERCSTPGETCCKS